MPRTSRQLCLRSRPDNQLKTSDLIIAETPIPTLGPDEVLVRNSWLSIDPSTRIRLAEATPRGYLPPLELGDPLTGLALGIVVDSNSADFEPGDLVSHMYGFRDFAVVGAGGATMGGYGSLTKVDPGGFPPQWFLGPLGSSGLTAYAGLVGVLEIDRDDVVWVSAAAGAVGSIASQLAKLRGCTVIGSAGSPAKVEYLTERLGLDAAFDYHDGAIAALLATAAPNGISAYFDNVGSGHLAAAIDNLGQAGRVAMCGSIADYDASDSPSPGPSNLFQLISKEIRIQGFRAGSYMHMADEMRAEVGSYLSDGRMVHSELVFDGLESAPAALIAMLGGENTGKTLCRIDS
ncbi:MAG: NADP-dependent oxidoreductase [Rhodococcus sp. (in: high G+C Gram-positive bacteria)]|uniref:NADP-dependent oxidoreductase n=1 Tax=Rhodococcus sp. TaxID=1831 RepID=UPI003BB1F050